MNVLESNSSVGIALETLHTNAKVWFFFLYIATHYEIIKKNASDRKISPRLIILHVGNVSMHDIKSATILLDGVVSAVKAGRWQPSTMVKKTF